MIFLKFKSFCKLLFANILVLLATAIVIEICGQTYAYFNPGFKVLAVVPDKVLGWKHVPKFEMPYTGKYWYAREFSAVVKTNSLGFRDFERKIEKDVNTIRIALLGDSMVAAFQVNFEKTAGQLLEKRLNVELSPKTGKKYEVLNFGVNAFGLGQYYLTYENYTRRFKPDYVFVYLFYYPYIRTINSIRCGSLFGIKLNKKNNCLWVRPTFSLTEKINDGIIKKSNLTGLRSIYGTDSYFKYLSELDLYVHAPNDYKKFKNIQLKIISEKLQGRRIIKQNLKSFNKDLFKRISPYFRRKNSKLELIQKQEDLFFGKTKNFPSYFAVTDVNLRILLLLNKKLVAEGSRLIVVDSFQFHDGNSSHMQYSTKGLLEFNKYSGSDYLPLFKHFNDSRKQGKSPIWKYDGHLNEIGNDLFANAMFDYLSTKLN